MYLNVYTRHARETGVGLGSAVAAHLQKSAHLTNQNRGLQLEYSKASSDNRLVVHAMVYAILYSCHGRFCAQIMLLQDQTMVWEYNHPLYNSDIRQPWHILMFPCMNRKKNGFPEYVCADLKLDGPGKDGWILTVWFMVYVTTGAEEPTLVGHDAD